MVQRIAARFVTADYRRRHRVTLLLYQLQWLTLLQRRTHSKLTMLYRIHHQLVAIPAGPPYIIYSNSRTRGHHVHQLDSSNNEFCGLRLMVRVEVLGNVNPNPNHNPNHNFTLTLILT